MTLGELVGFGFVAAVLPPLALLGALESLVCAALSGSSCGAMPKASAPSFAACRRASGRAPAFSRTITGEAGALELFGARSLPPVISAHNNYHLWGPGACDGSVMIFVNSLRSDVEAVFKQVEVAGQTDCRYCTPEEDGASILDGRQIRVPLRELWPGTRNFE